MSRRVADHARHPIGATALEEIDRASRHLRRVGPDARMIVVEDVDRPIVGIGLSRDPGVARAEVAVRVVRREGVASFVHRLAEPRPVVAMRRDDHPLAAKGMPALFPDHGLRLTGEVDRYATRTAALI